MDNDLDRKTFGAVCLALSLLAGCAKQSNPWVEIGTGPEIQDIPYRLISVEGENGAKEMPATNTDMMTLVLDLQSGRGRNTWVYIPLTECFSPDVIDGVPSILCHTRNNYAIYVGGKDNVREVLLGLKSDGRIAAIKGKVMGLYGSTPVVWVDDPAAHRKEN